MVIARGDIWWIRLPEPIGSAPGYDRPMLVVQANHVNRSKLSTVIGLVLTSNTDLAGFPGNVLLTSEETGLAKDSVVNITQLVTVDRSEQVLEFVGKIPEETMMAVDWNLMVQLGLEGYVQSA